MSTTTHAHIDKDAVKDAAAGRWHDIAVSVGIGTEYLTGIHGPCPRCGGTDRWRVYENFDQTGGAICNQCGPKLGDGFALVKWFLGCDFAAAVDRVADILDMAPAARAREFYDQAAKERQQEAGRTHGRGKVPENLPEANHVDARDAAGKVVGVSGKTVARIDRTYDYVDEAGKLLFQVCRMDPKDFLQRKPDGKRGWMWKVKGTRQVPYRLPQLLAADRDQLVLLCEGEKDVDRLIGLGFVATTNAGGAGKWPDALTEFFRDRNAVVLEDNDGAGRNHVHMVARKLHGTAKTLKTLALPGLPEKGDVSDWLDAGGTPGQLRALIDAAPLWEPTAVPQPESTGRPAITNCATVVGETDKPTTVPVAINTIIAENAKVTGNWPRRVSDALFIHEHDTVDFLRSESHLFGYYHALADVTWTRGSRYVTKSELFAELQRKATAYHAVEKLPHEPRLATHYYTCGEIAPGNGDHLRRLLDRFAPATDIDRDLILAAFVTPGWGGPPGARPAFCITSDYGRGIGKTTLAELIGLVWGGTLSFSHREDVGKIKTRLLTPDALTRRVALLDNLKSHKFSWAELEAMVTATTIGGHRMYIGEGTRPNTLTWFVTLNGASLSTDMAQRSVIIRLDRPARSGTWSDETRAYVLENHPHIIADIVGFLRTDAADLDHFTRWANWERDVLARLPEPVEAQKVMEERQAEADVEADEAGTIEEYFAARLRTLGYAPDAWVFIPASIANKWHCDAQNDRVSVTSTTRLLKQMSTEGRLRHLKPQRRNDSRGFIWQTEQIQMTVATDLEDRLSQAQNR